MTRIVHRADRGGLGQPIDLQDGDAEHGEVELRFHAQRRGTADERFDVGADHLLPNSREDEFGGHRQPDEIRDPSTTFLLAHVCGFRVAVNRANDAARLPYLLVDSAAHAFEQRRDVYEVIRLNGADFPRKLRQVGVHEDRTSAEQAGECRYPGSGEIQRRPLIDTVLACLIGSGVHQNVEALGGALQDVSYITRSDYYAFGFAGSAGGVDDCDQVGVGVWYLFVWLGHSLRQAQGRLCPSSCRPCLIRSKDLLEQRLRWSLRP